MIFGKCETHGEALQRRDLGRGKTVPECRTCERERTERLKAMFPATGEFSIPRFFPK
jgi:hypothetical protein